MLLGLHFGSLQDTKEPLHSRKDGNQMVQAHGAWGARLWSPLHKFPTQGDWKHPRLPSKTWDQLTSPKDYRSIKLITKTSPNKDLSHQVKGSLRSLSRVHILESSQTLQKSLINDIMWPSFSTQPMAVFLKVSPCRVLTQVWILHTPKRKLGALPFRVLDFNHQGANVTELRVRYPTMFVKGTSPSLFWSPKKP